MFYFFNFHPELWGRWTQFDAHIFSDGLKPPTRWCGFGWEFLQLKVALFNWCCFFWLVTQHDLDGCGKRLLVDGWFLICFLCGLQFFLWNLWCCRSYPVALFLKTWRQKCLFRISCCFCPQARYFWEWWWVMLMMLQLSTLISFFCFLSGFIEVKQPNFHTKFLAPEALRGSDIRPAEKVKTCSNYFDYDVFVLYFLQAIAS